MFGLPPPRAASKRLLPIALRMRNDDIDWDAHDVEQATLSRFTFLDPAHREPMRPITVSVHARQGTASDELLQQIKLRRAVPDDLVHPLAEALDDPSRFAAAHALLTRHVSNGWRQRVDRVGQTLNVDHHGLLLQLDPSQSKQLPSGPRQVLWRHNGPAIAIDLTSMAVVRDYWHTIIDVPLGSAPYWPFAAATAVLPAFRVASALKRRRDAKLGLCPA